MPATIDPSVSAAARPQDTLGPWLDLVIRAISHYGDGYDEDELKALISLAMKVSALDRIDQFAHHEDISTEALYTFIVSDILAAIAQINHGAILLVDIQYTPKKIRWVNPHHPGSPDAFFSKWLGKAEHAKLRSVAWIYEPATSWKFQGVINALLYLIPVAIDGYLKDFAL